MRNIEEMDLCECEGCEENAVSMVYSRVKKEIMFCCNLHSNEVVNETNPEYYHDCENCGCVLPVN